MKTVFSWFRQRPFRFIGGFLVFFSLAIIVFLVLLDLFAGMPNPYIGLLTYMIMPGFLTLGLLMVPLDWYIQRRRKAHGKPEPLAIDLSNVGLRKIVTFFGVSSVFVLISLTLVTYKGVEFMDTKDFCGRVCHKVMMPEYTAYTRSSHASVACIQCHIGPGASWFVRSKLSGLPQAWHYLRQDYPRPIETPVAALRPSRDTCENCHTPERFYGNRLRTTITYQQDEANTKVIQKMEMKVGSGGVLGSGIHSHMISTIDYLPASKQYKDIALVQVKRPDGTSQEFGNPEFKANLDKIRTQYKMRRMDCIDCHNRAAHDFSSYEKLIDDSITMRAIDPSIPFIKKQAMDAVDATIKEPTEKVPTEAEQKLMLAKIDAIPSNYEKTLPEVYKARSAAIKAATSVIRSVLLSSANPHMKVGAGTYPNWKSHDGCFRCHGTMEATKPGRDKEISQDCNYCHTDPTTDPPQG